jgi:hypothetical protein
MYQKKRRRNGLVLWDEIIIMKTFFIDLDGTIFKHGSNELLPGAKELIERIGREKGEVVWVTRRGIEFSYDSIYSTQSAYAGITLLNKILLDAGGKCVGCLLDCQSPRVLINDEEASAWEHKTNSGWAELEIKLATQ